ncbi:MAG: hypothetical protein GY714_09190 [Desulfobacterales bacterium]|nr:hypothetical protein [Desulfobacterales bacterium]
MIWTANNITNIKNKNKIDNDFFIKTKDRSITIIFLCGNVLFKATDIFYAIDLRRLEKHYMDKRNDHNDLKYPIIQLNDKSYYSLSTVVTLLNDIIRSSKSIKGQGGPPYYNTTRSRAFDLLVQLE